jgi:Flp pilus assembly pilin Flp
VYTCTVTRGQNVVEYALLLALVVISVLLLANAFGVAIAGWYAALLGRVVGTI